MLFDTREWHPARCEVAAALCAVLRASAEVAGEVREADGTVTPPQGQVRVRHRAATFVAAAHPLRTA